MEARIVYSMKRLGVIAILVLAFCGLADSAYLAQHVASGAPVICNVQGLSNCNLVIQSKYSELFGVPLADIGVLFYSILFVLAALELIIFDAFLRRLLQVGAIIGVIASIYFVSLEAFVIHAFCEYCLTSALITLLILLFACFIERRSSGSYQIEQPLVTPSASSLPMPPV